MPLEFTKDNSPWGLRANLEGVSLSFSAALKESSVKKYNSQERVKKYSKIISWSLVLIAGVCLGLQIFFNYASGNWFFLFGHELLNMPIIIGLLSLLYIWAKNKEQEKTASLLNLLHLNQNWQQSNEQNKNIVDCFDFFSQWAKVAWQTAVQNSLNSQLPYLSLNSLLKALLETSEVSDACFRLGLSPKDLTSFLQKYPAEPQNTEEILQLPYLALQTAQTLHNKAIDPLMLFCAGFKMAPQNSELAKLFIKLNISQEKLETVSTWIFNIKLLSEDLKLFKKLARLKPSGNMNIGLTAVPTPYLDRFSTDLSLAARYGRLPLALGRYADFEEIFNLFAQNSRQILIKGEVGTGRSTLVNELAFKMATEQVPKSLQDKRLLKVEISGLVGSHQNSETALENILNEAVNSGNIVLVIEDIEQLAKSRSTSGLNLLEILLDYLQNSGLQVIATCDLNAYVDFLQNTTNFTQVFTEYELKPLTQEQITLACCIKASMLEYKHNCLFLFQSIERAIELTNELVHGMGQPQKAIQLLSEAASKNRNPKNKPMLITNAEIEKTVSLKTHIPEAAVSQKETDKLLDLENILSKSIVGQKDAVKAICQALRRARSGLSSASRPLASFLFLGPTGVGKTEIAKTLAREYFGKEEFLLRLDMSEFTGSDAMAKFLGQKGENFDPPLIKHLKNYPYCLLLLDEFEKADPQIHNLFLQILDDGRLTTARGELLSLSHTLIIATSNAGTKDILAGVKAGQTLETIKQSLFNTVLLKIFPPELLNRFDASIVFSPLSPKDTRDIAALQLKALEKQLDQKGIRVKFSDEVIENIAKNAFDPLLGGRPVRRYIQDHIENFISELILTKKIDRGFKGQVDIKDGELFIDVIA